MKQMLRIMVVLSILSVLFLPSLVSAQEGSKGIGAWDTCPTPANLPAQISVGLGFGLSGSVAVYGQSQKQGVDLAVAEINANKYLGDGVTLVPVYEDGGADAQASISAFGKLVDDKVVAIIGPTLSTQAFAADPVAAEAGIPVLGVSNTANGITNMNKDDKLDQFIFRDSLPEASVIPGTIAEATKLLGLKKVGVLYGNDDDFTMSGYQVFSQALKDNKVEVTREETFARGDVDFSPQLTNIIGDKPDAIVVSALIAEAVPIVTQARQLGFTGPIIGGNGFNSPTLFQQAGPAAEGVIVGAAWNIASTADLSVAFTKAYEDANKTSPDQFAAQAYTGMWLVATGIRCADSADPAKIRDAMAAIKDFNTPLGNFSFDDTRNPVHQPVVQIVLQGKFAVLSEETVTQAYKK